MISRRYSLLIFWAFASFFSYSQKINFFEFFVKQYEKEIGIEGVEVYNSNGLISISDSNGKVQFELPVTSQKLTLFSYEFDILEIDARSIENGSTLYLNKMIQNLDEVELIARNTKIFTLKRLADYKGTSIYAGKKNEVILVQESLANLASNNARQIYAQVPGLNIYQNDDAGLQLNIGGRGLDPNRSSNFNTRQNGYDISADVLGYPESYYTPASEALGEVQIIRGAASLQYGTQFGGLVNFIIPSPDNEQPPVFRFRNTLGSNNLYTNFTNLSGKKDKLSYNTFYNFKKGSGFRENSDFKSNNFFINLSYDLNQKSKISFEITYFNYLCQQAGGLNDKMFENNPFQSNRSRNWFDVDWLLYNILYENRLSEKTNFSFSFFGLDASRKALGFRVNRVDQPDALGVRDLYVGDFNNFGFETRLLSEYILFNKKSIFLLGLKYYNANNTSRQGPGSSNFNADFNFYDSEFPYYTNQSNYSYPNLNIAFFGENILKISEKISFTPGFRLEYINTKSNGYYRRINLDNAFNVIADNTFLENRENERLFALLGIGFSFKKSKSLEFYSNLSQNYRSVTFADISIVNPAFAIDSEISDESGFTFDIGLRGNFNNFFNYDSSFFVLNYDNRIGFIQKAFEDGNVKAYRTNTGKAVIYGLEGTVDLNLQSIFNQPSKYNFNFFTNFSFISSKYTDSNEPGVKGNKVEFVPEINIKTGVKFGFKNFTSYLQYSYLSEQFSDSSNAISSNLSGVIGMIPEYDIMDFSVAYKLKKFKIELGVNNLLNNFYFTRRATGYPGPGIIPSPPRNYYLTIQYKL